MPTPAAPKPQLSGHDLAVEATFRHFGWHGERLDNQALAVRRIPDHQGDAAGEGNTHHRRRHAKQDPKLLFPDAEMQMLELFVQVMALVGNQGALIF
jgi:hypothetical protein